MYYVCQVKQNLGKKIKPNKIQGRKKEFSYKMSIEAIEVVFLLIN